MNNLKLDKKDWIHKSCLVDTCLERIKCLENAVMEDPNDAFVWHELGDIYADFDHDKAVYCWSHASESYKKRLEQFKDDVQKFQKNSNHLLFMNVDSADMQHEISLRLYNLGSCFANLEKYSLASKAFLKSYSLNSKNVDAIYYASNELYKSERISDAQEHLLEYLEFVNDYRAWYLLGMIYWKQNEINDAQNCFWECIDYAGEDIDASYHKHLAFFMLGNKKLAESCLKDAVFQNLNNEDMIESLIKFYEENDMPKRAYRYYRILHQKQKKQKKNLENLKLKQKL